MSKKPSKRQHKLQKRKLLTSVILSTPFILIFTTLFIYGFTDNLIWWLMALSSLSFFVSGIGALYVLPKKDWQEYLIKPNASYAGKSLSRNEAVFFLYVYAVLFLILGALCAVIVLKEFFF